VARDPEANGAAAPEILAQLAEDVLPTLIARLDHSRLGELEVRQDGWRIRLRRADSALTDGADAPPASPRRGDRRPDRPTSDRSAEAPTDARPLQLRPPDRGMVDITSPAVGYYVARDGLTIGSTVRATDAIGHIDVLGVRVEVVAPEDGLISAMDAEPGEAVEYGQTVARLERSRAEARS
jgi:biotin carboxyl carrier protein